MPYTFQPYPAHRHGLNGALRVVTNADEDAQALAEGFRDHPSKVGHPVAEAVLVNKASKAKSETKTKSPSKPKETPLEKAIEKALEGQPTAFDRAAAIATLEAANFEVDPETSDEELAEALAELAK